MIVISYLMKRKIKKIFIEVIFNTKIFYIKFCSMKLPTTKILPNLQGDWTTSKNGNNFIIKNSELIYKNDNSYLIYFIFKLY